MIVPIIKLIIFGCLILLLGRRACKILINRTANIYIAQGIYVLLGSFVLICVGFLLLISGLWKLINPLIWLLLAIMIVFESRSINLFRQKSKKENYLFVAFICLISIFLGIKAIITPFGYWDTKAIWALKANSIVADQKLPTNLYQNRIYTYSHWDYPVGYPIITAAYFEFVGSKNEQLIQVFFLTFFISLVIFLIGVSKSLFTKLNPIYVISGVTLFLFSNTFITYAHSGYADIPLSFAFCGAIYLLFLAIESYEINKFIEYSITSMILCLAAANIKNEGTSFLGILGVVSLAIFLKRFGINFKHYKLKKSLLSKVVIFIFFTSSFILWIYIKKTNDFNTDLFSGSAKLSNLDGRSLIILNFIFHKVISIKDWGISLLFTTVVLLISIIVLISKKSIYIILNLVIFLQALSYFMIYVLAASDLEWYLFTSANRLILQLIPAASVTILIAVHSFFDDHKLNINKLYTFN